jgi:hypothetical protein
MTDGEMKFPAWQILFHQVLAESDTGKLAEKIQELDAIMFKRLQQFRQDPQGRDERDALNAALSILRSIKRDKLGFPDWN